MFISIAIFALSCQSNNRQEDKEDYQFYYYPEKNVYYDEDKKNFWYSLDGGKNWDSLVNPSGNNPGTLGESVVIRSLVYEVYKSNETHRNLYKGKLYNIFETDKPTASSAPEVTERKVVRKDKTETEPKPDEENQKKGLKRFLNKIFGKQNKKTKEADSLDQ